MKVRPIKAVFEEFELSCSSRVNATLVIPTVKRSLLSRAGTHAYYFHNLKAGRGLCVRIRHKDIIGPGIKRFRKANPKPYPFLPLTGFLWRHYHYGFSFAEQIMLMTVPHTVTDLHNGSFIISLWAYYGYLQVDCIKREVYYCAVDAEEENCVLGAKQWYDRETGDLFYMSYSLPQSFKKALDPFEKVFCRIMKRNLSSGVSQEVWSGEFSDYMHDLLISQNGQYLVVCELGRFRDKDQQLIPSKVLILDLKSNKHWIISEVTNAAHAQFDVQNPEEIYFSDHNFYFLHTSILELLKKGTYSLKFLGPAAVYKYRLGSAGPEKIGVFTQPDLFRMTNFHVFNHRGKKLLAAMGAPNFIFIADAVSLEMMAKIEIKSKKASDTPYIGTFAPSLDGVQLYVQTTKALQIVNMPDGALEYERSYWFSHTCSNHMMVSKFTEW